MRAHPGKSGLGGPGPLPADTHLDGHVGETVVQQEIPVSAGDPWLGHPICAGVDEPAAAGQYPAGLADGLSGFGEAVQELVGAVAGDRAVAEGG
ncbi:hypothetical protein GCM10023192_53870 [Amycolatopsis samaneae]